MRKIQKRLPEGPVGYTERARELRKNSTDAERFLWSRLRAERIGVKFRRQEPIGRYIVDFACLDLGIVIEVDGSQHLEPEHQEKDRVRDGYLRGLGFIVLRFATNEVLSNGDGVLGRIWQVVQERKK